MKWTTKEGKEMDTDDMSDDHARNAIYLLMKRNTPQHILSCLLRGIREWTKENTPSGKDGSEAMNDFMNTPFEDLSIHPQDCM